MEIHRIENMKDGWFVGNFEPTTFKTEQFEVCYKFHRQGEHWPAHYHKVSTEINYLVEGRMSIQDKELTKGDIFILHPYEIANPVFLEDCTVFVVKTPSLVDDKYVI